MPFANNMPTDIKLNISQLAKIIQSGGFVGKILGNMMSNIGKKSTNRLCCSFG